MLTFNNYSQDVVATLKSLKPDDSVEKYRISVDLEKHRISVEVSNGILAVPHCLILIFLILYLMGVTP